MPQVVVMALFVAGVLFAQTAGPRWQPLQFMIGKWKGPGRGEPGAGQGAFS